jgi:hypothetical protein
VEKSEMGRCTGTPIVNNVADKSRQVKTLAVKGALVCFTRGLHGPVDCRNSFQLIKKLAISPESERWSKLPLTNRDMIVEIMRQ